MTLEFLKTFLLWSTLLNYAVLLAWFIAIATARDTVRRLHGRWFRLSEAQFDAVHYGGMGLFKLAILMFNLSPLVVLSLLD